MTPLANFSCFNGTVFKAKPVNGTRERVETQSAQLLQKPLRSDGQ